MNYQSLVQMLSSNISAQKRAVVLEKLTEMNNRLLSEDSYDTRIREMSRTTSQVQSRKKDLLEQPHPSMATPKYMDPHSFWESVNKPSNTKVPDLESDLDLKLRNLSKIQQSVDRNKFEDPLDPLDLFDSLDPFETPESPELIDLDVKLRQLTNLRQKIIYDKKMRK